MIQKTHTGTRGERNQCSNMYYSFNFSQGVEMFPKLGVGGKSLQNTKMYDELRP